MLERYLPTEDGDDAPDKDGTIDRETARSGSHRCMLVGEPMQEPPAGSDASQRSSIELVR